MPGAWSSETGDPSVIIAILDTGVDLDHPDLKNKLVAGYDYIDNDSSPDDVGGHGTHCAGIAAASTNNGKGVAGVCPNCSIMPVRVLGPSGGLASDVAKGIIWAVDHGAKVISMSLGGTASSTTQNDAVDYAWKKGAVVVAAAGNANTQSAHYPGYHSTCIAVASSEGSDDRSQFSNYGSWVDVAAPGSYIMSTTIGGSYGTKSGTSMATPFVAGLAGLVFSKAGKSTSPKKIRAAIEDTAVSVGSWVIHGRVDAKRAVAAVSSSSPTPTPTPTPDPEPDPDPVKTPSKGSDGGHSPRAYSVSKGSAIKSPSNSLVSSDNSLLVLSSTKSKKRRYLEVVVEGTVVKKGTPGLLQVLVEGRYYVTSGKLTAHMWNWTTSAWGPGLHRVVPHRQRQDGHVPQVLGGRVRLRLGQGEGAPHRREQLVPDLRGGARQGALLPLVVQRERRWAAAGAGAAAGTKTKEPSTGGGERRRLRRR